MGDEPCDCGSDSESDGTDRIDDRTEPGESTVDRWIADGSDTTVVGADLPDDLQAALGRFLGEEPIETVGEWIDECRRRIGDGSIAVDDLCHADEPTAHRGTVDGETYHFACFYDAVILSALVDRPVDVRTESPDGTTIEARAVGGTELTVTPPDAVFSFGIDEDVEPPADGDRTPDEVYAAVCPYVRAFPNREAYERWAEAVSAVTVATPLDGATALTPAMVE